MKFTTIRKKLNLVKNDEKDPLIEQLKNTGSDEGGTENNEPEKNIDPERTESYQQDIPEETPVTFTDTVTDEPDTRENHDDLMLEYNRLQDEYSKNPTLETQQQLTELNEKINQTIAHNQDVPEQVTAVEDDSDDQKENTEPEGDDEEKLTAEKEKIKYIRDQIDSHQKFVSGKRAEWREKRPDLEKDAIDSFATLQNKWNPKPRQKPPQMKKTFGRFFKKDTPEETVEKSKDEETVEEKKEPPQEKIPNETITAPSDLNPKIKEIWDDLDSESKLRIIEKHKLEREAEQEQQKKSVLDKKINFSLKRQEIKQDVGMPKKRFSLFNRKPSLKNIEAYCHKCKHEMISHQHKGKSAGCKECGCLVSVKKILEVNKIAFHIEDESEEMGSGLTCKCGHSEIIHKERGFCEEKECYCVEFQKSET